ncbi:hypothetical protein BWZ22_07495 [Seonamhaeicola sp. S2-3]|uniref:hypothetical protein n=1 Tax=Seonamhaeicola sp. S2-3 TaxID=1936081 RepID=UPI000972780D|nr:hypothetical protein [Seonamhaeicola sp. S2-3]APY11095.1 hypothetical protein BWZ22_07495 [Seonamhaeicola sp. S2-3]
MKSISLIALFTLHLSFTACKTDDTPNDIICTLEYVYGLNVTLIDATNSNKITEDITVVATDGNYEEILTLGVDSFFGAGERAGTYTITITSANYQTYVSNPIELDANECHVIPKVIEITLQPI